MMNKIKELRIDKLVPLYLVILGYCILSILVLGNQNYVVVIFDVIISVTFFIMIVSLLLKNEIRADYYQAIVITRAIGISIICYSTSVKHFVSVADVHWYIFFAIALISLVGLLLQLPYYTGALNAALPELKRSGKVQIQSNLWNIRIKTTYDAGKVESKLNILMKRLSFLSYLAPGIGMLVSRNLDLRGDTPFQAFIFMYLAVIFLLGAALPIGEYWLIREINKIENVVLKI